ncbi:MAG: hypothetical protein JXC31_04760, partial [Acholeplasmataceae bacterium]|nr:hypothetical protein [Acholeplasmataceae bacterium]
MIIYYFVIYFVILALLVHMGTVHDYALKKGYEGFKVTLIGFIPIYGYLYYKKKEALRLIEKGELEHLFSFQILSKRILLYAGLLLLAIIILVPVSTVLVISINNHLLQTLISVYIVIILFLIHQSTVVDYAGKKGYVGTKVGLIGLIPIFGFYYYKKKPKLRNVSPQAIKEVFKFSNMFSRIFVYAEITLVAVVVIVPVVYIFGMAFSNIRTAIPNQ